MMLIYLDNNATTQLDPRVSETMAPYLHDIYGNASSLHRYGRLIRSAIEQAREQIAQAVHAHPDQIIFTSGGTEANNLAIKGFAATLNHGTVAISAVEHPSVREVAFTLRNTGWKVQEIGVDNIGRLDLCNADAAIVEEQTRLVSLMSANNETGVIQPVKQVAEIARARGAVFHTDASQMLGKAEIDFADSGAHMMTLSSHKAHGPIGAGALVVDRSVVLQAQLHGGDHERNLRAGTENTAAIVGFGKAAELAHAELVTRRQKVLSLRQSLEAAIKQHSEVLVFAEQAERLPNTVQFGVLGCHGETLLLQLDRAGIAVSSGSACHSQVHEPSHVLLAMGIEAELALTAIRVSLSQYSTEQDIEQFIKVFNQLMLEFRHTNVRAVNAN